MQSSPINGKCRGGACQHDVIHAGMPYADWGDVYGGVVVFCGGYLDGGWVAGFVCGG